MTDNTTDKRVSLKEVTTKLGPILDSLEAESRNKAMSPADRATVATVVGQIRKLLDELKK